MVRARVVLEARGVDFCYPSQHEFGLRGVSLAVEGGRSLALCGFNAQGKSTLCRLLANAKVRDGDEWTPREGSVLRDDGGENGGLVNVYASTMAASLGVAVAVAAGASLGFAAGCRSVDRAVLAFAAAAVACAVVFALAVEFLLLGPRRRRRHAARVAYVSTEDDLAKKDLDDQWTLLEALTKGLPRQLTSRDRFALAERLLAWAGFRMFRDEGGEPREYGTPATHLEDKGITCGSLSGGQRHLIYLLRHLSRAYAPQKEKTTAITVLVLDEAFNCLDAHVRPRVLRLARHACVHRGVALVVVTQVLHEIAVLCDEAVFLHDGAVVERCSAAALVRGESRQADCARYVGAYWDLERDMRAAAGYDDADGVKSRCGADLAATIAALPPISLAGPPWERPDLRRGEAVTVVGLGAQRRYNGKPAVVLNPHLDDGRIKVRLDDTQVLSVKRANLRLVAEAKPPPPHGTAPHPKGD